MNIRTISTRATAVVALAFVALIPVTSSAADREHQQIMADLRILQEQTQQLQALMADLGEALKAVNSRIEDQTSLERKAFADSKVQLDNMSGDLRVVREKVDQTNVRLGTIGQELESLRDAMPQPGQFPQAPITNDANAAPGATPPTVGSPPPTGSATQPANAGISPQRMFDSSYADYSVGNYSLAVEGFESYLRALPKGVRAHEAQLYVGEALSWQKKDMDAIVAYDRVISNYGGSPSVPMAYYKRGMAFERLGETARARESYDTLMKQFPDSQQATLAKQRLEGLNRPATR
ncbi:MAG TPA: tetratricopeptide repeat protein [Vicinamibacterales bacterium]|nr:tetratricopeptide repeat protein [Vicinamibacterales bacterium]